MTEEAAEQGNVNRSTAVFIGDVSLDQRFAACSWPALGDKSALEWIADVPGGMIANAACVFATLAGNSGPVPVFYTALRPSPVTACLVADLQRYGIEVQVDYQEHLPDAVTFIFAVGANNTIMWPTLGVEKLTLSAADAQRVFAARWWYSTPCELRPLQHGGDGALTILQKARSKGVSVWLDLDVGDLVPGDEDLVSCAEVVIINSFGYDRLSCPGQSAAARLHEWGVETVICTAGEAGVSIFGTDGATTHIPAVKLEAVDATGAGDTFGGATLLAFARGLSLMQAVQVGNIAAALAVTRPGGRGGAVSCQELVRFCQATEPATLHLVAGLAL